MSFYLDTNFVVSLLFEDANSAIAMAWMRESRFSICVSAWTEVEFFALVNRWVRAGTLPPAAAEQATALFRGDLLPNVERTPLASTAGPLAARLASEADLKLSAADALHLALSNEGGHTLVTFDRRLAAAAAARGFAVAAF